MQCSRCHRDAIVFQPYSGLHLCGQHLIADVEAKAKKMIRAHGWLKPGDHIAVLLSRDRNSSALLYFLKQLTAQRRDIRISAITVTDETLPPIETSRAKRIADLADTELIEVSMSEESMIRDERFTVKNQNLSSLPLLFTSRFIMLEKIAQQYGITRIAWGLCLDDAAGVVLESIIRGRGGELAGNWSGNTVIPRICPFISVTEAEVTLYAELCGWGNGPTCTPELGDGLHKDTITMLERYTDNHPATKYALLNLGENLAGSSTGITALIHACEGYGEYQRECRNDGSGEGEVNIGAY